MRRRRALWLGCCSVAIVASACGKNTPEPPVVTPTPAPIESVTGTERLGWTQTAADSAELATFRYAIYVDGARSELAASCQPPSSPTSSNFECSAPLPPMPAGTHTVELATFIADGDVLESARSAPLQLNKTAAATTAPPAPGPAANWPSGLTISTTDGVRLRVDRIAEGLVGPSDIAFAPDGRAFVAEESGQVRVLMPDGRLLAEPALTLGRGQSGGTRLLALAVDPRFDETHVVYAIYTRRARTGALVATLARFREASNTLSGQIVLLDDIPATPGSAASLRAGAAGKLFAAFDDGGDARRAGDLASPNGKILRLNPDGTTPDDQAAFTPVYASDFRSPRGFDWQPASNVLWIADRVSEGAASLVALGPASDAQNRAAKLASYALPRGTTPSSVAFYRGSAIPKFRDDLLIASEEGQHLLRVRYDPAARTKVLATERLLQNAIGGVRVVAQSPGGVIYLATRSAIATMVAADR